MPVAVGLGSASAVKTAWAVKAFAVARSRATLGFRGQGAGCRLRWRVVVMVEYSSQRGIPMRDRWEYKMLVGAVVGTLAVSPHWVDADDKTDYGSTLSTEMLNRLGQDGWEISRRS